MAEAFPSLSRDPQESFIGRGFRVFSQMNLTGSPQFDCNIVPKLLRKPCFKDIDLSKLIKEVNVLCVGVKSFPDFMNEKCEKVVNGASDTLISEEYLCGATRLLMVGRKGRTLDTPQLKQEFQQRCEGKLPFHAITATASSSSFLSTISTYSSKVTLSVLSCLSFGYCSPDRSALQKPHVVLVSTAAPTQWVAELCHKSNIPVYRMGDRIVRAELPHLIGKDLTEKLKESLLLHQTSRGWGRSHERGYARGRAMGLQHSAEVTNQIEGKAYQKAVEDYAYTVVNAEALKEAQNQLSEPLPSQVGCALTRQIPIFRPALSPFGHTYDYEAVVQAIASQGRDPTTLNLTSVRELQYNQLYADLRRLYHGIRGNWDAVWSKSANR